MKLRALPGWLSPLLIHILSVASSKPRSPSLSWKGCNRLRAWFTMCPDIIASAYGENLGVANDSKPIWLLYNTPLGYWTTVPDSWKFCQVVINTQICCSQISNDTVFQNAWLIFFSLMFWISINHFWFHTLSVLDSTPFVLLRLVEKWL